MNIKPSEVEILLIEDNSEEAQLTIRSLKKHNLANRLLHFDDGEEALEFIFSNGRNEDNGSSFRPKLILLDLKLPKMNGLDILRRLKGNSNTRTLPVVVLTSSKEERDITTSYELGVNSYVVKPVKFDSFSKTVAELGTYWMLINQETP